MPRVRVRSTEYLRSNAYLPRSDDTQGSESWQPLPRVLAWEESGMFQSSVSSQTFFLLQ